MLCRSHTAPQKAEALAERAEQDSLAAAPPWLPAMKGRYELTLSAARCSTPSATPKAPGDGEAATTAYGGGQFQDLSRHPERVVVKRYTSAAAGAYQFLPKTWKGVAKELRLASFEPRHQDQAALHLVERRGALGDIDRQGLTKDAMAKLAPEWASFPTKAGRSAYGQPVKSHQELASFYSSNLRQLRNQLGA